MVSKRTRTRIGRGTALFVTLAALAIATSPEPPAARSLPVPAPRIHFTDVTDEAVFHQKLLTFPRQCKRVRGCKLNPFPGPGFADWDNDGDPDLPGYRNDRGRFVNVRAKTGIAVAGHYRGGVWGDFDGDRDFDLVSLAYVYGDGADMLFRNDRGRFRNIAPRYGMNTKGFGETASWGDFDGDGDLDLLVGNYACGHLWRNNGRGGFADDLASTGIDMRADDECGGYTRPESSTFFDFDGDGWLDVYVAGRLWRNRGDGAFEDVTAAVGGLLSEPIERAHDEGFAPVDVDNDGDFDLSIFYALREILVVFEYVRDGDGRGRYVPRWRVRAPGGIVGTYWVDADHDGDLDLFTPVYGWAGTTPPNRESVDRWYRNDGNWSFAKIRNWRFKRNGKALVYSTAMASFGDYDRDGDLDLAVWKYEQGKTTPAQFPVVGYRLLRNDLNRRGGWLRVRVVNQKGAQTENGAVVRLRRAGERRIQTRYVNGGTNWTVDEYDVDFAVRDAQTYQLSVTFPRRQGRRLAVVDSRSNRLLRFKPGRLRSRTLEIRRDGRVRLVG